MDDEKISLNWGGLIEAAYSLAGGDFEKHENFRLFELKKKLELIENSSYITNVIDIVKSFTDEDIDYLCSPLLDAFKHMYYEYGTKYPGNLEIVSINTNNLEIASFLITKKILSIKLTIELFFKTNSLEIVKFIVYTIPDFTTKHKRAIEKKFILCGSIPILEFLFDFILKNNDIISEDIMRYALQSNSVKIISDLFNSGKQLPSLKYNYYYYIKTIDCFCALRQMNIRLPEKNEYFKFIICMEIDFVEYIVDTLEIDVNRELDDINLEYLSQDDNTPLVYAVSCNNINLVKLLLRKGATQLECALYTAMYRKNREIAKLLVAEIAIHNYDTDARFDRF